MSKIIFASCALCRYFVQDTVGDGSGIGDCKVYLHYKNKGMSDKGLEDLFKNHLGNKVFYKGTDLKSKIRKCNKFVEIEDENNVGK